MRMIAVLVVLVAVVGSYGALRWRPGRRGAPVAGPAPSGPEAWVAAGIITTEQAEAIAAFDTAPHGVPEAVPSEVPHRPRGRISPAVEALAYVGGILLAVGSGMLVGRAWHGLGTAGHLGVAAAVGALAAGVGAAVGESDTVTWRLRGFLWAIAGGAAAAFGGLTAAEVADVTGPPVALSAGGLAALVAAGLWWGCDRPLQHLETFVGTALALGAGIAWAGGHGALIGLALWVLGVSWAGLAWQERLAPAIIGFPVGVLTSMVACAVVAGQLPWLAPLAGLATALGWVSLGVAEDEVVALAPGVLGIFVFLPWTLARFFGDRLGAPVVAMLSGALLLAAIGILVRRGHGRSDRSQPAAGLHRWSGPRTGPLLHR